ncbi:hypothetical protein SKTS_27880 [Sulfurimicrobium lacus]|uniref:Thioredoxin domain-containing protein n=1 Tax=Sulfurimicrobium lacus TaxID=2715678 RepID=A0A6F8VG26_9PROT|nr:thioredoxin fold domain-containing protein [Sulfurimicrobium lacus]BCB27902.1 hypothetical protein SKTS_27880 [Sulfurimicrobium lacus]
MLTTLRKSLLLAAVLLGLVPFAHAASEAPLAPGLVHPGYEEQPAWFKNSFLDLREDVAEAAKHGKRVLLYFYQDGCPYCKKLLQDNLGQRTIADKTRKYFDVIAINMWGDREVTDLNGAATTEKDFAKQMKVMFTPTLVALDEKGGQALRINGYYAPHQFDAALDYVGLRKEHELSFKEYLAQVAPAAAQGKLHGDARYLAPPYRLDRAAKQAGKPLLVLFEQKQCLPCDELHLDIFKRQESVALLDKFNIAQFDQWAATELVTPDGKASTARDWARALKVNYAPTMIFFDGEGRELFRAEAYLKAFHVQSALDYVASAAYRQYPEFQRFVEARGDAMRAKGIAVDLMK